MARTILKIKTNKMHDCTRKPIASFYCDYCMQAIESHGEKLIKEETIYPASEWEILICDFCGEDAERLTKFR